MNDRFPPGMLVISALGASRLPEAVEERIGAHAVPLREVMPGVWVAAWGLGREVPARGAPILLSGLHRNQAGSVDPSDIADWVHRGEWHRINELLPPFGALGLTRHGMRLAVDPLGFQQAFHAAGSGWAGVSTSAPLLARLGDNGHDEHAWLVQSQLGWQLGDRTVFAGVRKIPIGRGVLITRAGVSFEGRPDGEPVPGTISLGDAVDVGATALREHLDTYLGDTPQPVLQLTGGQDSRLVFSAIAPEQREVVTAVTLGAADSPDVTTAARVVARAGARHLVGDMDLVARLEPEAVFALVLEEARRHQSMDDPLARAVTGYAERALPQGCRLGGFGGEVARGFYYPMPLRDAPVTRSRSDQLARWRLLANHAVEAQALSPRLRELALPTSLDSIYESLVSSDSGWLAAVDNLYLRHRVPRWGGLGESTCSVSRPTANPLLDHRLLWSARSLAPGDKANGRFLARLQVMLDPDLARERLDNRPAPVVYAFPGPAQQLHIHATTAKRLARKVRQRLARKAKPAAGTALIANRLTTHAQREPEVLHEANESGLFSERFLAGVARGECNPGPTTWSFVMNVLAARGK